MLESTACRRQICGDDLTTPAESRRDLQRFATGSGTGIDNDTSLRGIDEFTDELASFVLNLE